MRSQTLNSDIAKRDEGAEVIAIYRRRGFDRPRHERTRFDSGQSKRTRLKRAVECGKAIGMLKLGSVGTDPEPFFESHNDRKEETK